jgi:hypothetical protein
MAESFFFDDLERDASLAKPKTPIWQLDLDDKDNEKEILAWLNAEAFDLEDKNEQRYRAIRKNLMLYKGIQYMDQERSDIREQGQDRNRPVRKIVANHLYDLVQQRVSRLIKYKPAVAILPTNDELSDHVAAKSTKALLDHIWYTHNFEGKLTVDYAKISSVMGEAYFFVTWNPDKGDIHPDYSKAKKEYKDGKIPLLKDDGTQEVDDNGKPRYIERPVKTGDVEYTVELPTHVLIERCERWEDVNYCFRKKVMPVEKARILYPKQASKIKASENAKLYNYETMELEDQKNQVTIYEFYHKKNIGIPEGRFIAFTKDVILANTKYPFDHESIPCVRLSDIDVPGELHGKSGIENIKALTSTYNNILNLILRNQILVSHPKWMMPAGAAKKEALGNDITIVEYKGPQAPQLVQANPTSAETYNFLEKLKELSQQIYGVYGVSRGEPPAGIKSGVALQFLAEQESERFNESILKYNEAIRQIAVMTLSVCGTYYDENDGRMIRVLGKNNQWMTEFFDAANLSKDYDVRVQNSSALPQSKAARMDLLFQLSEKFPDRFTPDQMLDMLDLAQSDKFIDASTKNVQLAESENEMILSDKVEDTISPQIQEDHFVHWRIHVREMQTYQFKFQTPDKVRENMEDHVRAHEMFMMDLGAKSETYAQQLTALNGFPLFFKPESVDMPQALPNGVADQSIPPQNQPIQLGAEQELVAAPGGLPPGPIADNLGTIEQQGQGAPMVEPQGPVQPSNAI